MAGLAVQQKGTPAMETASSEKALLGMAEIFFFYSILNISRRCWIQEGTL